MTEASDAVFGQIGTYGLWRDDTFHEHAWSQVSERPFFITGVLGPHAKAHGPKELLDLAYVKKLMMCVALVLAAAVT